eukprot:COSAG06_NODE_37186_length_438_cov_0.802360_1_plen_72_part_01
MLAAACALALVRCSAAGGGSPPCFFWGNASNLPPPAPPAPQNSCASYHTGIDEMDPSGGILQPDGVWHLCPD